MKILLDPKVFNYFFLVLSILSMLRWAYERNVGQTVYWAGTIIILIAVTFLMRN